jgi:hypothetical protein
VSGKRNVGICGERRKNGIWHQAAASSTAHSSTQYTAHSTQHTAHSSTQYTAAAGKQEQAGNSKAASSEQQSTQDTPHARHKLLKNTKYKN